MALFDGNLENQHLVKVGLEDDGLLVTFGDGLVILFSGKRLRRCAFAHTDTEASSQHTADTKLGPDTNLGPAT